jgi:hypothetical protein
VVMPFVYHVAGPPLVRRTWHSRRTHVVCQIFTAGPRATGSGATAVKHGRSEILAHADAFIAYANDGRALLACHGQGDVATAVRHCVGNSDATTARACSRRARTGTGGCRWSRRRRPSRASTRSHGPGP